MVDPNAIGRNPNYKRGGILSGHSIRGMVNPDQYVAELEASLRVISYQRSQLATAMRKICAIAEDKAFYDDDLNAIWRIARQWRE